MRIPLIVSPLVLALPLALAACASADSVDSYNTGMRELAADCQTRGGVLAATGQQSGNPARDNVCKVTGQPARANAAMGSYRLRHLEYKAAWRGGRVALADRWFPSSKLCACCGFRLETLVVDVRQWTCPGCGASHDRDVNAAINPRNMAVSSTASACGGEDAGPTRERRAKPVPAKQESNSKVIYG